MRAKKGYHKAVLMIFLLIIMSALFMYQFGTDRSALPEGATAMAVHEEDNVEYPVRPIQDVTNDFEKAGWERVAND